MSFGFACLLCLKPVDLAVIVQSMRMYLPRRLLFFSVFLLVACGSSSEAEPVADGGAETTTTPSEDVCDPSTDDNSAPVAPGAMCAGCTTDADCGDGYDCLPDARGIGFCTSRCDYFGETICPRWFYCKQFGNTSLDFYCSPLAGVCESDGNDCSTCETDTDCNDGLICYEPLGDIRFCARPCEDNDDCPSEYTSMACGSVIDTTLTTSLCMPKELGIPTPKCGALPLGFCEPCETAGQCSTGLCVSSPNVGQVCSKPCESTSDCPSGTDCVQNACLPPVAYGCQGFLSCLGVTCIAGEECYRGFCLSGP